MNARAVAGYLDEHSVYCMIAQEGKSEGCKAVNEVGGAQILLVEDDEVVATLLADLLGRFGDASTGPPAPSRRPTIVGGRDWDLMVSDIDLPGMDGLELSAQVRPLRPHLAIAGPVRPQLVRPRGRRAARRARTTT